MPPTKRASKTSTEVETGSPKRQRFTSFSFGETVEVIVGTEKKVCTVHKRVLCDISDFFKGAFEGKFIEASKQSVVLEDVEPRVFDEFMLWMYTQQFSEGLVPRSLAEGTRGLSNNADNQALFAQKDAEWELLLDLYIFADKFMVTGLHNPLIDAFIEKLKYDIPLSMLSRAIFSLTPVTASLRKLWVYEFISWGAWGGPSYIESFKVCWPFELLLEATKLMADPKFHKKHDMKKPHSDRGIYYI